ncbi:hypothetical protein STXM2123_5302 [Streptomyces sp. F-3]|nr:hypothetical protein STXM2123_5302 [Streptomyces sp. F-3]
MATTPTSQPRYCAAAISLPASAAMPHAQTTTYKKGFFPVAVGSITQALRVVG